jgi:hypothetical protein
MKQLFLFCAFSIACIAARAQATSVTVQNSRPCPVYFVFYGDNACSGSSHTNLISIPGFTTVTYPSTATPGAMTWTPSTPPVFNYVRAYQNNPAICPGVTFTEVGYTSCSGKPVSAALQSFDPSCTPCSNSNPIDWAFNSVTGNTIITFHP